MVRRFGPAGIDLLGRVAGYYVDAGGTHGFLLSNGSFSTISYPGLFAGLHPNLSTVEAPGGDLGGARAKANAHIRTAAKDLMAIVKESGAGRRKS